MKNEVIDKTMESAEESLTDKSREETRINREFMKDNKINNSGKRTDKNNVVMTHFKDDSGPVKQVNLISGDDKINIDLKLEHYFDNMKLNEKSIDYDNFISKSDDFKSKEDETKVRNKEISLDKEISSKDESVLNNDSDETSKRDCEISATNLLDANALAMYQNTMNKSRKNTASKSHKKSSDQMDEKGDLKLNIYRKDETETNTPVNAVPFVRKMSGGLVGVIPASQKSKKVQSKKFGTIAKHVTKLPEKVLYARSSRGTLLGSRVPVAGGVPIDEELAMEMRTVAFGSSGCPPRGEWIRTPLTLRPANQPLAYGLTAPRNGCRGLLTALGAHVLKHLLFGSERPRDAQGKFLQTDLLLRPDEFRQQEALIYAIAEVIWRASGDTKKAFAVIPQEVVYVQHSHAYYQDSVTEKLHIFEFHNLEDVQIFVKRYLYLFDEEPGCGTLLLLYSCMLTRGLENIKKDLDGKYGYLTSSQVEGSINVVMLLLTGRATPYLHNGVIYVGDEDHYALPQYGVLARSSIGLLEWRGSDDHQDSECQPPGSRLKTPALPIWVTFCAGHFGMLFNTNRELLRNYHAERRFDLQYYTCGGCYVFLSVDTRALTDGGSSTKDDINATPLEKLIHTKWQDAKITWTGQTPYVGEMIVN